MRDPFDDLRAEISSLRRELTRITNEQRTGVIYRYPGTTEDVPVDPIVANRYTTSTTWNKPAGLRYVRVRLVAGGGGGGGVDGDLANAQAAGGGGGGGYAEKVILAADLGSSESVTVGTGGAGGADTGTDGSAGTSSSFGAHCSATGGAGGEHISVTGGGFGGPAGSGSGGDLNVTSDDGHPGAAGEDDTDNEYKATGGNGGGTPLGGGGAGPAVNNGESGPGTNGNDYGGGGGGAASANNATGQSGGTGADGVVLVEEYF
jgi:hypothetical protein